MSAPTDSIQIKVSQIRQDIAEVTVATTVNRGSGSPSVNIAVAVSLPPDAHARKDEDRARQYALAEAADSLDWLAGELRKEAH